MAIDFYPIQPGDRITPEMLNSIIESTADGSIFYDTTFIGSLVHGLASRVTALESRVTILKSEIRQRLRREQHELVAGQATVNLEFPAYIDSELLFLNGISLSKTGIPTGFVGDYSIVGSIITFDIQLSTQIHDGDMFVVQYTYEV